MPNGEVLSGAEAVFVTLTYAAIHWPLWLYRHLRVFELLSEAAYELIASHRTFFYHLTRLTFGQRILPWKFAQTEWLFLRLLAAIYVIAWRRGMPEDEARALAFFSLVTVIVALIFVNRSFSTSLLRAFSRPNAALKYVLCGVVGILALTLAWPVAAHLFRFGPLHADDLALTLGAGVVVLVILDFFKPSWAARQKVRNS